MQEDIRDILIDRQTIQARVHAMAEEIARDWSAQGRREFLLMPL
jgi:hypothetical protein